MVSNTLWNIEEKMKKTEEALTRELTTIRTGRANPALIEHIKVEYADTTLPLNQLASISTPEAKLLVVQPWDKSVIHSIEKAILKSDLGLNPASDGNVIRLSLPPLTEERRHELIKVVKRRIEESRISIRNLRREAMSELEELEKSKEISQDEHKRSQDQLQKLTDSFIADLEHIGHTKENELMEI
ncbi:ribosome recycling factor [Chloroflexota bacterium]